MVSDMTKVTRAALFGRLNAFAYGTIASATDFCKMRSNPEVEIVHWLHQILAAPDSDLHRIIRHFDLAPAKLAKDLTEALDRLPRGAASISDFSPYVVESVELGWALGARMSSARSVRTGHLLLGMVTTSTLRQVLAQISTEFDKIAAHVLTGRFDRITAGSPEAGDDTVEDAEPAADEGDAVTATQTVKREALDRYAVDLTEKARRGQIDPIVGRDDEIRKVIDILMRRRQNNPILTGEAGVGKTAVAEGFAQRIASGDVPPVLREVSLLALDIGLLRAGASMKGEFESRLRRVVDEVQSSPKPIILFIDEAHTLIGAGGAAGTGDAANLLKPALARGTLRTIAATTWAEYKKYFEKDAALTRRFQVVHVEEPSEEKCLLMVRGMAAAMELHHRVQILDEALEAAVRLSHRYIPARQLPDKAISLIDTAAARVKISQYAVPAEVERSRRCLEALDVEMGIIRREAAIGLNTISRQAQLDAALMRERDRLAELQARWETAKSLVTDILALHVQLRGLAGTGDARETGAAPADGPDRALLLQRLATLSAELKAVQGETPLILTSVDAQGIAAVVGDWTGIPVGQMVKNEIEAVLKLADTLGERVIGQSHGFDMIAKRIQTARAGLDNANKPIGVFMLCGPSGVGKTETALALAEALYGGETNIITINMSEFQEAHTVSTLKGSPPGYVGYGEGGILTEAVRRKPYSVVLLDEVEKAHSDVHELFFQVFDKGVMEDGEGRLINFRNTLILLTSNVGSDLITTLCRDPDNLPDVERLSAALRAPLLKIFPAALLGRIVAIPYYPLSDETLAAIIRLQLRRIERRIYATHKIPFTYDPAVVTLIAARCTETESGGRMIDAILTNTVLPALSRRFLERTLDGQPMTRAHVGVTQNEFSYTYD
jgi:type VI secretion system protein VasG